MLLPGKPQPTYQAVSTGEWQRKRIIAYISGTALAILAGVDKLIQTIYHDDVLSSVAFSETSGKFAVASKGTVYIYSPNGRAEGYLKWCLQKQITIPEEDKCINSLSWGGGGELLVGSNSLTVWSVGLNGSKDVSLLWRRSLANPAKLALYSPDASLTASVAEHDRLVKVWRKISIGAEDVHFDFTYLPHPIVVENIYWRQPTHPEQSADNVLYTFTGDHVLRIWAPVYPHDIHILQLWATVDLTDCGLGLSRGPGNTLEASPSVLIIDNRAFTLATESAVYAGGNSKTDGTLQRLCEVAARAPEVVVAFDKAGRMSAWGLENIGCKSQKTINIFPMLDAEQSGLEAVGPADCKVRMNTYASKSGLVILAHYFDGRIAWMDAQLDRFLDPSPRKGRLALRSIWSGHSGAVRKLVRTMDGKTLLTSTDDNDLYLWNTTTIDGSYSLERKSLLQSTDRVRRAVILQGGRYVMTLYPDAVILWDTSSPLAQAVVRLPFSSTGKVLAQLILPESTNGSNLYHVVAVDAGMRGFLWEIRLPHKGKNRSDAQSEPRMKELSCFTLPSSCPITAMIPVDSVGWTATLSDSLDVFSREVAVTVCASGLLQSWTMKYFEDSIGVRWLATSNVYTGVRNPSLAKGSSIRKIALVDSTRSELTIWDSRSGCLEYQKKFEDDQKIRDLDWTSTPQNQSILAVGFPHRVLLLCQLRYDYLDGGLAWGAFREINIEKMTSHPIGDSIWLHNGGLVIGSGNQLFTYPRKIDEADDSLNLHLTSHKLARDDLFNIVSELNGPLPVYHPQFLQQCILAGKASLAETILLRLLKELQRYHEEIGLDRFLDIPLDSFTEEETMSNRKNNQQKTYFDSYHDDVEITIFDEAASSKLSELLINIPVPHLTGPEQINLAVVAESVAQVQKHRRSIDENGAQYLLLFRQHTLRREKRTPDLSFREFIWAFHSNSQDILVDLVSRNSQGKVLWPQAREAGLFVWLRDPESIKRHFEIIARNHYIAKEDKDPVDCSLYYLALKKKKVLAGLWRIASWHREQAATFRFLSNNFAEAKWKTAAMKNAYALMGKHRFEYAAAFFLLADNLKDAINILFNQLNDLQLAIAVARVYEGDEGPALRELLETKVLPLAVKEGNRWLASWCFWMLNKRDLAVQSLITSLDTLVSSSSINLSPSSRLFLLEDPALIIFYQQLREMTSQTLKGAVKIPPNQEFEFVLQTARLYDRMGCDLLALDLVKNWTFLKREDKRDRVRPLIEVGPRRAHVRRRSSITVSDDEVVKTPTVRQMETGKLVRPPVSVFEEPDMSWAF